MISLVAFGNWYLVSGNNPLGSVDLRSARLNIADEILFIRQVNSNYATAITVANSIAQWFHWLNVSGAVRLTLLIPPAVLPTRSDLPANIAESFAGGSNFVIQVDMPSGVHDLWKSSHLAESVNNRTVRHKRYLAMSGTADIGVSVPLSATTDELRSALESAINFTQSCMIGSQWENIFRRGLAILCNEDAGAPWTLSVLPSGYNAEAQLLLSAIVGSWVFGGMGSWNDLSGFNEIAQAEYDAVTARLYQADKMACVAVANAFDSALLH